MSNLKETIKVAIKDATKDLGLKQYPKVKVEESTENYVMSATGTVYASGLFIKTITKTESDYILHINKKSIKNMTKRYAWIFGNKKAAHDYIYLIVCHELRHMWQYQEQFTVGTTTGGFSTDEMFYGHGATRTESDANQYMIGMAERKGLEDLACFMEMEQRSNGMFNKTDVDFNKQMHMNYKNALKRYNKALYFIVKCLSL